MEATEYSTYYGLSKKRGNLLVYATKKYRVDGYSLIQISCYFLALVLPKPSSSSHSKWWQEDFWQC